MGFLVQALHMHQLKRTKAEEEERIAAVLQQRMHDSERSAKELQQLRNESAELRDLQVSMLSLPANESAPKLPARSTLCCQLQSQIVHQHALFDSVADQCKG